MSSTFTQVLVTKATPDVKLGLQYMVENPKPGQQIVQINDTKVEGLTRDEIRAVIESLVSDVTIVARNPPPPQQSSQMIPASVFTGQGRSPPPPSGVKGGGQWGTVKYGGDKTAMMCVICCLLTGIFSGFGFCAYLCPMDEKDAYKVDGVLYDSNGKRMPNNAHEFTPYRSNGCKK